MNSQHPAKLPVSSRRYLIFLSFLFFAPFVLTANPNIAVHFTSGVIQRPNELSIKDTLAYPPGSAPSSDYVEATYPGGAPAWMRHLSKTFRFPADTSRFLIEGTVTVTFLVDAKGRVRKAEAISGPEYLRPEAVRVIKLSGKWLPATINGSPTESYKQQSIIFKFE